MNSWNSLKKRMLPLGLAVMLGAGMLSGCGGGSTGTPASASAQPADGQLQDGDYAIALTMEGGTGKATIASPASLHVEGGKYTVTLRWSSPNYDYMLVNGVQYDPVNTDGNSVFEIPLESLEEPLVIQADTTAMTTAHLIDYTLTFDPASIAAEGSAPANDSSAEAEDEDVMGGSSEAVPLSAKSETALAQLTSTGAVELMYAKEFTIDTYEGGYALISVSDSDYFLMVPEGSEVPAGLGSDVQIINGVQTNIYLAASSAMDLIRELGALDAVSMTATTAENWSLPEVKEAVSSGAIQYVGKYSAPDYETILARGCGLAVESTMIYHSPEVKEQLESLGIPVLVEHSSYESDPLGRMEWIKLYGVLTGHLDEAVNFFDESIRRIDSIDLSSTESKSVVFFYISSSGYANVRKPGDYISKMIEMAGGTYALTSLEAADDNSSTMNMQMETFFAEAKDADIIIYNSTTEGTIESMSQLLGKSELLAGFKAVQNGQVWCTGQNMFQQTTGAADMVTDINKIITGEADGATDLTFLHKVQ